jgi:putative transcriptional regulator
MCKGGVFIMYVTNKLRSLRFEHEMDQKDFAAYIGANKNLYNKWENQKSQPSLEWALKIALLTERTVESIFSLSENPSDE